MRSVGSPASVRAAPASRPATPPPSHSPTILLRPHVMCRLRLGRGTHVQTTGPGASPDLCVGTTTIPSTPAMRDPCQHPCRPSDVAQSTRGDHVDTCIQQQVEAVEAAAGTALVGMP